MNCMTRCEVIELSSRTQEYSSHSYIESPLYSAIWCLLSILRNQTELLQPRKNTNLHYSINTGRHTLGYLIYIPASCSEHKPFRYSRTICRREVFCSYATSLVFINPSQSSKLALPFDKM